MERNIDIESFVNTELQRHIDETFDFKELAEILKINSQHDKIDGVIKIIERMCRKESKFNTASRDGIIAEAEIKGILKEEVEEILDALLKDKFIYEPTKMNYKIARKGL